MGAVAFLVFNTWLPAWLSPWIIAVGLVVAQFDAWREEKNARCEAEKKSLLHVQAAKKEAADQVQQANNETLAAKLELKNQIAQINHIVKAHSQKLLENEQAHNQKISEIEEAAAIEREQSANAMQGLNERARRLILKTKHKEQVKVSTLEAEVQMLRDKLASETDALYNRIRDAYLNYLPSTDNSLCRLVKCGATELPSDYELTQLCEEIKKRTAVDPFKGCEAIPEEHRLEALNWIRDRQVPINNGKQLHSFVVAFCTHLGTQ